MDKKYLDENALTELIRRIATGIDPDCELDREALEDILPSFHDYVNTVVQGETRLLLFGQKEGQPYRELVSRYDQERHGKHETAIANVRALNRLAAIYELNPVFTGDDTQRHQMADFCLELDRYLFVNRSRKLA